MPAALHRLRALLFDIDGTLTDTEAVHYESWTRIHRELGLTIDPVRYARDFIGLTSDAIVERNFPALDPAVARTLPERKESLFRSLLAAIEPTPGVRDFIAHARDSGLAIAAVTNAPRANAELILGRLGLLPVFATLVIGDELARGKPDPLPYLTALDRLGVDAGAARVYEDSAAGVRAGVAAGVETVGIDQHAADLGDTHPLRGVGAVRVIRDFRAETL